MYMHTFSVPRPWLRLLLSGQLFSTAALESEPWLPRALTETSLHGWPAREYEHHHKVSAKKLYVKLGSG